MSDAAAVRHGRSRPDACSVVWDSAHGSALGTAPLAKFWLALEQSGPWGAQAATQSHLDPDLGEALTRMCQDAGGRFILIRRPGTHSDLRSSHLERFRPRRVYVAGGLATDPWLLEADLADPARLAVLSQLRLPSAGNLGPLSTPATQLDPATELAPDTPANLAALSVLGALGSGDLTEAHRVLPELKRSPGPVLMICANSRRDVCCSVRGRPVALESASQRPGKVWECSHTGGHRFAPTGVLLPRGQSFGRLSGASALAVIDAAMRDEIPTALLGGTYDRGRSHLSAPEQASESIVRQQIQEPSLAALSTTAKQRPGQKDAWQCRISHVDGRHWDVVAVRGPTGDDLPESCGREPVPSWRWSVVSDSGR